MSNHKIASEGTAEPARASEQECEDAAVLEIAANHLRALGSCNAPIGVFIRKLIDDHGEHCSEPDCEINHR